MDALRQDLRYALRTLARSPGFTALAVLTLALGIGGTTAVFSLLDAVLLHPIDVADPGRLVAIDTGSLSYPAYTDFRDQSRSFRSLSGMAERWMAVSLADRTELVTGAVVSGNYFATLGVGPHVGRLLAAEDDGPQSDSAVAVLSHAFFTREMGADAGVLGKTLRINQTPFTIVGVAPPGFRGARLSEAPAIYVPMAAWPRIATGFLSRIGLSTRGWSWVTVFGRLREGATLATAQAELNALARRQEELYPGDSPKGFSVTLAPLRAAAIEGTAAGRHDIARFLGFLAAAAGLGLTITCANVSGLLLSKAAGRRREIAIRQALGAGSGRLARQLLTESALLALLGGAAGILVALWAIDAVAAFQIPGSIEIARLGLGFSPTLLGISVALAGLSAVLFGAAPALRSSRSGMVGALKDAPVQTAVRRIDLRSALLSLQVALSILLLVGAGLVLRSLRQSLLVNPGFDVDRVALASMNLGLARFDEGRAAAFTRAAAERVRRMPGVESASWAALVPVSPDRMSEIADIVRRDGRERVELDVNFVGPGYLRTMGIPLSSGRDLAEADTAGTPPVALVNEALARRYWPGEPAVGKRIRLLGTEVEIAGVAHDSMLHSLGESPAPLVCLPVAQRMRDAGLGTLTMLVRVSSPEALLPSLRRELNALEPSLPLFGVKALRAHVGDLLMPQRFAATLLGLFGLFALILATVGIYGVASHGVAERTRDLGIRIALGASRRNILALVLGSRLAPVAIGLSLGLASALSLSRLLSGLLFGVAPTDPLTYAAVGALLGGVALAACLVPAWRATRVDPMAALRHD